MADRLTLWLVRHHPAWWRRRYEAEMLALLESNPPDAPAVLDLARSCCRTWFECQLPSSEWGAGSWWQVAVRLTLQLPLAAASVFVTVAMGILLSAWAGAAVLAEDLGRPSDAVLVVLAIAGPLAASAGVAIAAGLSGLAGRYPSRVTVLCVVAAGLIMAGVVAISAWSEPDPGGSLALQQLTSPGFEALRSGAPMTFAYAAAVGLIVRMIFRGLPLRRCIVNCVHHRIDTEGAVTS